MEVAEKRIPYLIEDVYNHKQLDTAIDSYKFSFADMAARAWLTDRMQAAGLDVRLDAAANVIGTLRATGRRPLKVLAIGSHLDTDPQGGKFDGALGMLAGLECARVIRENGIELPWDLEVINFCDEDAAIRTIHEKESVNLSESLIELIQRSSRAEGLSAINMPSGAGHDAQSFASHVPSGMIFIPCYKGKSHCPQESIEPQQASDGCQVLLATILALARQQLEDG
ncbi:N-carbamoyl-L-amino acid hydrolase (EC [Olavius algarvensis Delta 1 endosymbiont]|nr:N-carbamoyl-L-amino acid hydrolase (EC [Olavius algarvensis Delta 1 endosymbiont]